MPRRLIGLGIWSDGPSGSVFAHLQSDLPLTPEGVRAMGALRLMVLSESERHFKPRSRSLTKAAQLEMVG
jgi:hypothetical protein